MGAAPTSFGKVKVTYTLARHGSTIEATLVLPANAQARLRLRLPAGEHVRRVVVGSTVVAADRGGTIDLGNRTGAVAVSRNGWLVSARSDRREEPRWPQEV